MLLYTKKPGVNVFLIIPGFFILIGLNFSCGVFSVRPDRHLSYAETAYVAAQKANAETVVPQQFQLARETLFRARAAYRLKDFKSARSLALRARLLAEEAEFKSLHKDSSTKDNPKVNEDEETVLQ